MKRNRTTNSGKFVALAAGALAAGLTLGATATTYHVDGATGNDNDDGELWSTAFKTVRKALLEAGQNPGPHEIFVAAGTYYPDEINGGDSNDRDATFSLVNGVSVYGGFLNGDDFEDRDPETNITILSGDIDQNYDQGNPFANNANNSFHVVTADGVGITTIINGFTITGGNADGTGPIAELQGGGGGMTSIDSTPIIVRCVFFENSAGSASSSGGGAGLRISIFPSGETLAFVINCSFIDNKAIRSNGFPGRGGGLVTGLSTLNVTNCLFSGNTATGVTGDEGGTHDSRELTLSCANLPPRW